MNIAFVNNQYQLGGAETVIHQLRDGLKDAGHESQLFVALGKTFPRDEGVRPLYPRMLSRLSHSRLHRAVQRMFPRAVQTDEAFRRLAASPADLIHLHNFHGDYASIPSLAYLASQKRMVWTFHAFWGITGGCDHPKTCLRYLEGCGRCPQVGAWPVGDDDKTAMDYQLKKALLAEKPIHVVAPSRHLARRVQESPVGRRWALHQIPNGVNPAQFGFARKRDAAFRASLKLDPQAITVLVVNRNFQDAYKGWPMVLDALCAVSSERLQVILAGEHSDWAAAQLPPGLPCCVVSYVHAREKLAQLYEAAEVFLFASPAENFPCVVLEAMSAKCCVVATPTSGVTEQIEPGQHGFLASELTGDSLGEALRNALAEPELRLDYAEQARHRVAREFSEDLMVARYLKLYQEVALQKA